MNQKTNTTFFLSLFSLSLSLCFSLSLPLVSLFSSSSLASTTRPNIRTNIREDQHARLEGILRNNIVAIGGETTGVGLYTEGRLVELDLSAHPEFHSLLERYNQRPIRVEGYWKIIRGIEIPLRKVLVVEKMEPI